MQFFGKVKAVFKDTLFWRVTVCLFALPFVYLGGVGVFELSPPEGWWWLGVALLGALGIYGIFLVYAALFGTEEFFKRAMRWIDGADLIGLLFIVVVGLIAIPLTMLLRLIYPRPS